MQKLYEKALSFIDKNSTVIEGYSGAGILSCLISKKAKQVYAIEVNKNASLDAEFLKKNNNITNLQNINGNCETIIPNLKIEEDNLIFVLDPPQSGCEKSVLDSILKSKPQKIIYISCNPYTLKQNAYYLKEEYKIERLEVFDMFPNTKHIESLCVLKRIH